MYVGAGCSPIALVRVVPTATIEEHLVYKGVETAVTFTGAVVPRHLPSSCWDEKIGALLTQPWSDSMAYRPFEARVRTFRCHDVSACSGCCEFYSRTGNPFS